MSKKTGYLFLNLLSGISLVLVLQACGPAKPGIWENEKIAANKRADFHKRNAEMLKCLQTNRYLALQFILSKELLEDPDMIRTVEEASIAMKQDSFKLLREYYVAAAPNTNVTISERELGVNNFDLFYKTGSTEMYVAFFVQGKLTDNHVIAAFFDKFDYGWKLSRLEINQYTIAGKTAPELYTLAAGQQQKGYLVDAINTMSLVTQCIQPSFGWYYTKDVEITKFHKSLVKELNQKYLFPFEIGQVATHPQIIRITNQKMPDGEFPKIYYLSKIKLADTVALKKENQQIKQVIGTLMPGIDKDKKYVLYAAYNEQPSPKFNVDHFDMTDRLQ